MARWRAALVLLVAVATVARASDAEPEDALSATLRVALGAYQQCAARDDALSCLKLRALRSMDGALRRGRIPLVPGLALVPSEGSAPAEGGAEGARAMGAEGGEATPLQEVDEAQLPADPEARRRALDDLLADRVGRFLRGRSLQLDAPAALLDQGLLEEGRKKGGYGGGGLGGKKNGGLMMMALMMKSGLMAMAFKGVALLAGKALLVAKIALVLAAVVGLSKLLGGGGDEKTTYEIVKHPHVSHAYTHSSSHEFVGGHGGGGGGGGGHYDASGGGGGHGWGRSMDAPYPHLLAYRGQLPDAAVQPAQGNAPSPAAGPNGTA